MLVGTVMMAPERGDNSQSSILSPEASAMRPAAHAMTGKALGTTAPTIAVLTVNAMVVAHGTLSEHEL